MTAESTTRIVIISGNEYQVPLIGEGNAPVTEQMVRDSLKPMFPDITNASLQKGKRVVDGIEYETWEFVKRAGTKGATGADVALLLAQVPRLPSPHLGAQAQALLAKYFHGQATVGETVAGGLLAIVNAMPINTQINTGGSLCMLVDMLPAAAGSDTTGW